MVELDRCPGGSTSGDPPPPSRVALSKLRSVIPVWGSKCALLSFAADEKPLETSWVSF